MTGKERIQFPSRLFRGRAVVGRIEGRAVGRRLAGRRRDDVALNVTRSPQPTAVNGSSPSADLTEGSSRAILVCGNAVKFDSAVEVIQTKASFMAYVV